MKEMPVFVQSVVQARRDAEEIKEQQENQDPNQSLMGAGEAKGKTLEINPQNANSQVLKRNIRAGQVHIN